MKKKWNILVAVVLGIAFGAVALSFLLPTTGVSREQAEQTRRAASQRELHGIPYAGGSDVAEEESILVATEGPTTLYHVDTSESSYGPEDTPVFFCDLAYVSETEDGDYSVASRGPLDADSTLGVYYDLRGDGSGTESSSSGSRPVATEELWIIQQPDIPAPGPTYDTPGTGSLLAIFQGQEESVPVPLKHTDVQAHISAYIATVDVTQQYHNPYSSKIEAEYVFPLPQNAAVNEFIMTIGDRRIRGIIRKREEAEEIYREARSQGYVASLLTQERANVFTQKVANIEPGKEIDINIKYFHTLAYCDGWYQYVFPMVVGPRFNPPGTKDGIGAVGRGENGRSGQKTEVQYLKPGERSGHDISLAVNIDAGVKIEEVSSSSHVIKVKNEQDGRVAVQLSELDAIPNRDFVLSYRVAGDKIKSGLLTHHDDRGGFFSLMVYPPVTLEMLKRKPLEMVFVIDCSGSMNGDPIAQAKTAIKRALMRLEPGDSFQIIRFSNNASQLGAQPVEATPDNIERALAFVDTLDGQGGTMMIEGIKAALDFPHDDNRLRFVTFLTDGFIGNDAEILGEIHDRLGASRIFSFGVGSSTNRYLMERMAKIGHGAVAYLSLEDDAGLVMDRFFDRISHPALTDVSIDFGGMKVSDTFPASLGDLFVGRPAIVTGRYDGELPNEIVVRGSIGDSIIQLPVAVNGGADGRHKGLAAVWARAKIADLADRSTYENPTQLASAIEKLALEYSLMSAFTSFVAVDSLSETAGEYGTTVSVPVNVPEGVRYETAVGG